MLFLGQGTKEQTYKVWSSKTDNLLRYEVLKEKVRTAASVVESGERKPGWRGC